MDYVTTVTEVDSSHDLLELSPGFLLGHAPVGHEVICEVKENTGLWTQQLLMLVERAGEVGTAWVQRGFQLQHQTWKRHKQGLGTPLPTSPCLSWLQVKGFEFYFI